MNERNLYTLAAFCLPDALANMSVV
jgi:hypothetical protein